MFDDKKKIQNKIYTKKYTEKKYVDVCIWECKCIQMFFFFVHCILFFYWMCSSKTTKKNAKVTVVYGREKKWRFIGISDANIVCVNKNFVRAVCNGLGDACGDVR